MKEVQIGPSGISYTLKSENGVCEVTGPGWRGKRNLEILPITVTNERDATAYYLGKSIMDHLTEFGK